MMKQNIKALQLFVLLVISAVYVPAQNVMLGPAGLNLKNGLWIQSMNNLEGKTLDMPSLLPFLSYEVNDKAAGFSGIRPVVSSDSIYYMKEGITVSIRFAEASKGYRFQVRFINQTGEAVKISNVVPLGRGDDKVYITGAGGFEWPYYLNRSQLFRPGYGPIGVVLPDNAWHLGFCDVKINNTLSLTGLARRMAVKQGKFTRWHAELDNEGEVVYNVWFDFHEGPWQQGLRMMFQERWLYDLKEFDNRLFERGDLAWIRKAWINLLQFAWDQTYYDSEDKRYKYYETLNASDRLLGGYDIFTLWPTWPRLGLDARNQFDLYYDLPGGIEEIRRQAEFAHQMGKKYFISYNPWDASTRHEDHMQGLARLLRETQADGVVLDTRGESSRELQETADAVRPGIIMYSEGMAVPGHMPGIPSGRVHDALFMPPPVNLNKFIKPDFAIFRVLQLADGYLHREIAASFFNGYGVEINTMRPGRPESMKNEMAALGRTTKILRENQSVFFNYQYEPMLPALTDSIYVNKWKTDEKIIYTVFSLKPEGFSGPLFVFDEAEIRNPSLKDEPYHFVSLWNHEEIEPVRKEGQYYLPVRISSFERDWLGTRREAQNECIAVFPKMLEVSMEGDSLHFSSSFGDRVRITAGNPSYAANAVDFDPNGQCLSVYQLFGRYEGKIVVQLFAGEEIMDERILEVKPGTARKLPALPSGILFREVPEGMIRISKGSFPYNTGRAAGTLEPFVYYPEHKDTLVITMPDFLIDKYPVTNAQFRSFLTESRYIPDDTANFLKHWRNGKIPPGLENHPVVYISHEDACAYALWAGKRLPTEQEWQYAAQGSDHRAWPWGQAFDSTRCNLSGSMTTPVDAFPDGESPFGVADLVGNVWQMTADVYDDGAYYFLMLKGGSHFHPRSSQWYVEGGPMPVYHRQILLRVSPSFDRSATVGFRCVADFVPAKTGP